MDIDLDAVTERSLRAVSLTRAAGPHYYANLLGLTMRDRTMHMEPDPGTMDGVTSVAAVATLADVALGAAIRERVDVGTRLATVTLALHHLTRAPRGALSATASLIESSHQPDGGNAVAECRIHDSHGAPVAVGTGWFVCLTPPQGVDLGRFRWNAHREAVEPVESSSLSDAEAESMARTIDAGQRAYHLERSTVIDELLAITWDDTQLKIGIARGRFESGPHLANRVGHVQGGALYGAAAICAGRLVDPARMKLADVHMQYLSPANSEVVEVQAEIVKRGRRVTFISCSLGTGGTTVATSHLTYRKRSVDV